MPSGAPLGTAVTCVHAGAPLGTAVTCMPAGAPLGTAVTCMPAGAPLGTAAMKSARRSPSPLAPFAVLKGTHPGGGGQRCATIVFLANGGQ
jgi:hypothetical protein